MKHLRRYQCVAVVFLTLAVASASGQNLRQESNRNTSVNEPAVVYENYGPAGVTLLTFVGIQSILNGSIVNTGPAWQAPGGFPYVLFDQTRNVLLLHPGTFATANQCASVAIPVASDSFYIVAGGFARANNFRNAGDGVQVKIFTNLNENRAIYTSTISSNHDVNPDNPFAGTGVVRFRFISHLNAGDTLRFVVCSGPQKLDGTFDVTALDLQASKIF